MIVIELAPVPNQKLRLDADGQTCDIQLRETRQGFMFSLKSGGQSIVNNTIVSHANPLNPRTRFKGLFAVIDTKDKEPPQAAGLGSRWKLVYLSENEIPT